MNKNLYDPLNMKDGYKAPEPKPPKVCSICLGSKSEDEFYCHKGKYRFSYCKNCTKEKTVKWKRSNPHSVKGYKLKEKYGMTQKAYDDLHGAQDGRCAICQTATSKLGVDHNHVTGRVRGLLCANCNHGLGKFMDDPLILERAVEYVRQ